jgi:glycosyltransferase 2 family protein
MIKKEHWKLLIRFIGFVVLLIILLSVDFKAIWNSILKVNTYLYFITFVLLIFIYILKSLRWKLLLRIQGIQYSFLNCLIVFFSANFIAFITPGRVGEIAKAFYLKRDTNVPFSKALPTVLLDRFFDIYALLVLGIIGFFQFSLFERLNATSIIILSLILIVPFFFLFKEISMPVIIFFFSLPILDRFQSKIIQASDTFFGEIKILISFKLIYGVILTFMAYFVLFYIAYLINLACGYEISFFTIVFFVSVANILSFIPISISGIGTREASFIYLFSLINMSKEDALLFSTLFFITFYIVGGVYGFIFYNIKPIEIGKMKEIK